MEKSEAEKIEEERIKKEKLEEEQVKKQKKTLISFFIIIGIMVLAFLATWYFINASKHFTYKGVDFYLDENAGKGITLFKATMVGRVTETKYNFYFRNEPVKLEQIPINGTLTFRRNMVFDSSVNNFNCDGNGILAISQFANGMKSFGFNLIRQNESVQYIPAGDYMFFHFISGNSTEIKQVGFNNYYEIVINNCEILPAMERIMLELLVQEKGAK